MTNYQSTIWFVYILLRYLSLFLLTGYELSHSNSSKYTNRRARIVVGAMPCGVNISIPWNFIQKFRELAPKTQEIIRKTSKNSILKFRELPQ